MISLRLLKMYKAGMKRNRGIGNHALVQFFDLTFVMKNKKNFPNALL